jgi:hypothetical protein
VAIKILLKTMDSSTPSPDRVELSTLRKNKSGEVLHEMLTEEQVFFIIIIFVYAYYIVLDFCLNFYYLLLYCFKII